MKYCSQCGATVVQRVPEGDDRLRYVCEACSTIHYQNPKLVVGCIAEWNEKILLCRRAIEPRLGLWTLPAGFMENGETAQQGALRETLEEACARVALGPLYALFNLPHIDQVYLIFRGRLLDLDFGPGPESLDVRLFDPAEIPWDALAFPVIKEVLRLYQQDRREPHWGLRSGDIERLHEGGGRYRLTLHAR